MFKPIFISFLILFSVCSANAQLSYTAKKIQSSDILYEHINNNGFVTATRHTQNDEPQIALYNHLTGAYEWIDGSGRGNVLGINDKNEIIVHGLLNGKVALYVHKAGDETRVIPESSYTKKGYYADFYNAHHLVTGCQIKEENQECEEAFTLNFNGAYSPFPSKAFHQKGRVSSDNKVGGIMWQSGSIAKPSIYNSATKTFIDPYSLVANAQNLGRSNFRLAVKALENNTVLITPEAGSAMYVDLIHNGKVAYSFRAKRSDEMMPHFVGISLGSTPTLLGTMKEGREHGFSEPYAIVFQNESLHDLNNLIKRNSESTSQLKLTEGVSISSTSGAILARTAESFYVLTPGTSSIEEY